MKISIVHPSYGRPLQALECYVQWRKKSKHYNNIQWIISLSSDDTKIDEYCDLFDNIENVTLLISDTMNVVQAANIACKYITGDFIILVSDDMYACDNWDDELIKIFEENKDKPLIVQIDDSIRKDIMTLPIMNYKAYEKLQYLYHPKYISMYADNDLTEVAKSHNMYYDATHLKFDHRHYSVGKSEIDDTYRKENSNIAFEIGKRIFEDRKNAGFPIQ